MAKGTMGGAIDHDLFQRFMLELGSGCGSHGPRAIVKQAVSLLPRQGILRRSCALKEML